MSQNVCSITYETERTIGGTEKKTIAFLCEQLGVEVPKQYFRMEAREGRDIVGVQFPYRDATIAIKVQDETGKDDIRPQTFVEMVVSKAKEPEKDIVSTRVRMYLDGDRVKIGNLDMELQATIQNGQKNGKLHISCDANTDSTEEAYIEYRGETGYLEQKPYTSQDEKIKRITRKNFLDTALAVITETAEEWEQPTLSSFLASQIRSSLNGAGREISPVRVDRTVHQVMALIAGAGLLEADIPQIHREKRHEGTYIGLKYPCWFGNVSFRIFFDKKGGQQVTFVYTPERREAAIQKIEIHKDIDASGAVSSKLVASTGESVTISVDECEVHMRKKHDDVSIPTGWVQYLQNEAGVWSAKKYAGVEKNALATIHSALRGVL